MKILLTFFAKNKIFYFKIESCTFDSGSYGNPYHLCRKSKKILGVLQVKVHSANSILKKQIFFISKMKTRNQDSCSLENSTHLFWKTKKLISFQQNSNISSVPQIPNTTVALNLLKFFARNKIFYFKIESYTFDSGSHGNLYHLYRKSKKLLGVLQIKVHSAN